VLPDYVSNGFLRDGREVLIIPLSSGGSGGVFATLLYTRKNEARFRFVGYVPSATGRMGVSVTSGELLVVTPISLPNEPNCCPSKHLYERYTLDGIRLRKLRSYTAR
jgi:hypothetical protein